MDDGNARLVFWTYGFEYISGEINAREINVLGAIKWLLKEAPSDGAKIEFIPGDVINFGPVEPKTSKTADVIVRNTGIKALNITRMYFEDWTPKGVFVIDGESPKSR